MSSADAALQPRLYRGQVMHRRLRPVEHRFTYPVFFVLLPLHQPELIANRVFSLDRWNLFSFHRRDHGGRDGAPLLPWLQQQLGRAGIAADGPVWLQTFPRVLGFVFNPVSFWYCHDRAGALVAILAEVSNTFGERHNYLLAHPDHRPIVAGDRFVRDKVFHVSPFFAVAGSYRFVFGGVGAAADATPGERLSTRIEYFDGDGACLDAAISGRAESWGVRALLRAFVAYPWLTLGVVLRIHWQALRLYLRGLRFFRKPPPPFEETT